MNTSKNNSKIIGAVLSFLLIISMFSMTASAIKSMNDDRDPYTHTVLIEIGTAQWCGHCHPWNTFMYNTYNGGSYDFEYVMMIMQDFNYKNLNLNASNRMFIDYGITYVPTSYMDGNFQNIEGNEPTEFPGKIDTCGNRAVADINAEMILTWIADATFSVDISIQNNEISQYNGHIRAYVTEIVSRYDTSGGNPYNFGFLDYAFNQDITINPGEIYSDSATWNGNDHSDLFGNNFGDITKDNIKVILGVFDENDIYADETIAAEITNDKPNTPSTPSGSSNGNPDITLTFSTVGSDPNDDQLEYLWDWGNGDNSGWLGPYDSGYLAEAVNSWSEPGNYFITVKSRDSHGVESDWSDPLDISIVACGDANADDAVNVGDAVFVINYVFKDGPAPNPVCRADANGDGEVNVGDAVFLINYVFKGGDPPVNDCCSPSALKLLCGSKTGVSSTDDAIKSVEAAKDNADKKSLDSLEYILNILENL